MEHTQPDDATLKAEPAEEQRAHTAEHFHEMNEIGANTKGEDAIE